MKRKIEDEQVVPVVKDGAIATKDTGDGKLIPVVIVDTSKRQDLLNLIRVHQESHIGDVTSTWGETKKAMYLVLDFERPMELTVALKFHIPTQGSLVEGILNARGFYLQSRETGPTVVQGLSREKIIVEVSPETRSPNWDKIFYNSSVKSFREKGLSKRMAKKAATQHIARIREFWGLNFSS